MKIYTIFLLAIKILVAIPHIIIVVSWNPPTEFHIVIVHRLKIL